MQQVENGVFLLNREEKEILGRVENIFEHDDPSNPFIELPWYLKFLPNTIHDELPWWLYIGSDDSNDYWDCYTKRTISKLLGLKAEIEYTFKYKED